MDKTIFFVLGITLILAALALAAAGLRNKDFPSPGAFKLLVPFFALLVGGTAVFAVLNANAEHQLRDTNSAAAKRLLAQDRHAAVQQADNPTQTTTTGSAPAPSAAAKPSAPTETLK